MIRQVACMLAVCLMLGCNSDSSDISAAHRMHDEYSGRDVVPTRGMGEDHFIYDLPPALATENNVLLYRIPVVNDSERRVNFKEVKSSCGCAEATLEKTQLEPGEKTELRVGLRGLRGGTRSSVSCMLVPEAGSPWKYGVRYSVFNGLDTDPSTTIAFGAVDANVAVERTGEVILNHRAGEAPPTVRVESTEPSLVQVELSPTSPAEGKVTDGLVRSVAEFKVTLAAQKRSGPGRCRLTIASGEDDSRVSKELQVNWYVRRMYQLKPERLFFRSVNQDSNVVRLIAVERHDQKPFSITEIQVPHPALTCKATTSGKAPRHEVEISLNMDAVQGTFARELTIHTDWDEQPEILVPVSYVR